MHSHFSDHENIVKMLDLPVNFPCQQIEDYCDITPQQDPFHNLCDNMLFLRYFYILNDEFNFALLEAIPLIQFSDIRFPALFINSLLIFYHQFLLLLIPYNLLQLGTFL